ncbi:MAG: TonB-dependent receptor plug domain-containing protein, partial [Muribaculaceae bacterium]|nr:TonB-dependent receptor plug domain-containing protein [Muribaculaceae bacterium]
MKQFFTRFMVIAIGMIIFPAAALTAQRTITGVIVSSDDQEPLIGASVTVSETQLKKSGSTAKTLGTVTDIDGKFSLTIPSGVTEIECRNVGYNPRTIVLVDGVNHYDIILDPSSVVLSDVVVTGYQAIERRKLTASITKMEVDENKIGSIMNIDQALAGQVAGLSAIQSSGSPGAPLKIRIRGTSSLQGTQDPLWVIDGVPMNGTEMPSTDELKDIDNLYQSSIAGLNPADIESITVLKDAAATAIYGTRAANGVIVITTKSGKQGKAQVSFSTRLSYSPKPDIDRLNLLNSDEKVDLELSLLGSNFTYRENKGAVARILQAAGQLEAFKAGGWSAVSPDVRAQIDALRGINTDWNDILFRDTFSQEYNLSVSGGGDKATYYTSLGYQDEKGNVPGVSMNRFNIVLKTNYRLSEKFKVGASVFANRRKTDSYLTDNDGFTNPVYYSRRANPYQQPYDALGNYVFDTDIQGREDSDLKFNVFEERNNTDYTQETTGVTALIDADLRFTDYLKAVTQVGFQYDQTDTQSFAGKETYAMRKELYRTEIMGADGNRKTF